MKKKHLVGLALLGVSTGLLMTSCDRRDNRQPPPGNTSAIEQSQHIAMGGCNAYSGYSARYSNSQMPSYGYGSGYGSGSLYGSGYGSSACSAQSSNPYSAYSSSQYSSFPSSYYYQNQYQSPTNMYQSPSNMYQSSDYMYQSPSNMYQSSDYMYQTPSSMYQSPNYNMQYQYAPSSAYRR